MGMVATTFLLTMFHGSLLNVTSDLQMAASHISLDNALKSQVGIIPMDQSVQQHEDDHEASVVHGLECEKYGGPLSKEATEELRYWKNIPQDREYVSPFKSSTTRQYLTFEPDGGTLAMQCCETFLRW